MRHRFTKYPPGTRVVQFSTNRSGDVVAVLPRRQRLVASGFDRGQDRRVVRVVRTRDLRREVTYR